MKLRVEGAILKIAIVAIFCFRLTLISSQVAPDRDSLHQLMQNTPNDSIKWAVLNQLAQVEFADNSLTALQYATEAVDLAREMQDTVKLINTIKQTGTLFMYAGLFDNAASYFSEMLSLAIKRNDRQSVGVAYFNMGTLRTILEDFEKAIELQDKGIAILTEAAQELNQPLDLNTIYAYNNNLGVILVRLEKYEEGAEKLNIAIEAAKESRNVEALGRSLGNLGDLYAKQNQYEAAKIKFEEALEIFHNHSLPLYEGKVTLNLGEIFEKFGEDDRADTMFMRAYHLAKEHDNISLQKGAAEKLANLYKKQGKSEKSLEYFLIVKELGEQMKINSAVEQMARQELLAAFSEKEKELSFQVVETQSTYRKYIRLVLFGVLVALVFLFTFYKKFKKESLKSLSLSLHSEKLELEKKLLQAEVAEKEKQLVTKVMYELQVNQIIGGVVDQLIEVKEDAKKKVQESLHGSIKKLKNVKEEKVWEEFEKRYLEVHVGFYDELNNVCPSLTRNERRLCAFLRLDMSSKEIATITGQSIKAIEVGRSRLRKKLNLTNSGQSLTDFLVSLGST